MRKAFTHVSRRLVAPLLALLLLLSPVAGAAARPVLQQVRFGAANNRIVFDLDRLPVYNVSRSPGGRKVVLDIKNVTNRAGSLPAMQSALIEQVVAEPMADGLRLTITLAPGALYRVAKLVGPTRVFFEAYEPGGSAGGSSAQAKPGVQPFAVSAPVKENRQVTAPAPGLELTHFTRTGGAGALSAYVLKADRTAYAVRPALDGDRIAGLATVRQIAAEHGAVAAVNSAYFAPRGWLIGLTKLGGTVISAAYPARTAVGLMPDGQLAFGTGSYRGTVAINGVERAVDGVNCERAADSLVVYNRYYDRTTGTNAYGTEYVVRGGRVAAIVAGNAEIPADGFVISVHGAAQEAFRHTMVGDRAALAEDMGMWGKASWMQGAGPRLVQGGQVNVTAKAEAFPADIASGRAPRTAFGVDKDGNYIFLVVDGRQKHSIGCTLSELATLMKRFGAVEALNFDGGGSSEMVVGGEVLNSPSDGSERRVGCALILTKR